MENRFDPPVSSRGDAARAAWTDLILPNPLLISCATSATSRATDVSCPSSLRNATTIANSASAMGRTFNQFERLAGIYAGYEMEQYLHTHWVYLTSAQKCRVSEQFDCFNFAEGEPIPGY